MSGDADPSLTGHELCGRVWVGGAEDYNLWITLGVSVCILAMMQVRCRSFIFLFLFLLNETRKQREHGTGGAQDRVPDQSITL